MLYIKEKVFKDLLSNNSNLFFIKKRLFISDNKSYWQPVKKIAPYIFLKYKVPFIDYTGNFELINQDTI